MDLFIRFFLLYPIFHQNARAVGDYLQKIAYSRIKYKKAPSTGVGAPGGSVCDGSHEGVFRLRHVQTGDLHHDGLVGFHQDGVGGVARDGLALVVDLLIQADVVGTLVLADGVEAAERGAILKVEGQVDVGGLTREIQHADSLVADEFALGGITHVTVGDEPGLFSVHDRDSFRIW
jgi:hypothetical protein